ncbi:penicillin acylase family protein [Echinicola vietnamensis]|uniref:Penicilin amidase n=1 Tax=Echinicola vietnamensis (strain DSM 17526 / LMG 23754 / KMM 6221) TaxID=926556 RepID=L0G6I4_ECHVK|nr:penicillin acylase family protein [Echinicola vietnamensis]AGA80601.1 penicilin amidase [Echinicola vietnamensis DSM 17526]
MKYFGFLIVFIVSLVLAVGLSVNFGQVPSLGYLMDPYHGFWQNAYSEDELAQETLSLEGLHAPVTVVYDQNLIPHVFAETEADLMMAQGYVTAQHRLWQMEFQTRAAAGRISEIVGSAALDFDRMQRRKGLGYGAEMGLQFLKEQEPATLELIHAYTEGVNRYIDQLDLSRMPVEYKILDYRPEEWTPYKTVLLLKYMADMLVGDKDLEFTNLRHVLGGAMVDRLFPDIPLDNDPVIEADHEWDFEPLPVHRPDSVAYPDFSLLMDPMPAPEPGVGSNNWAVAGEKTENGHPILANDPHLGLNLPSLWYAMQLSTPEYTVKGATLPGALGVISGFNEQVAWGVTNATRDVRDWYAITFKDNSRLEYRYNDQWIQSAVRVEEIAVKGDVSFMDTVIYTHYGPVVYDEDFRPNGQKKNFALKWTAHEGSNEQQTFLDLNAARDHGDYLAALDHYTAPAQNFVFASSQGDIAMKVQGKFPLKWPGQGKYLMDGNDPAFEWNGYIPSEHNPSTLNPARGFVSSANQYSVGESYPYYIFDNTFEDYRNRRINGRLREMEGITMADMQALQFDDFDLHAAEALPVMLEKLKQDTSRRFGPEEQALLSVLEKWDYYADPDVKGPVAFELWWDAFKGGVWKWLDQGDRPIVLPGNYMTTFLMKETPNDSIFDLPSTTGLHETVVDHLQTSFKRASQEWQALKAEQGEDVVWATYKNTTVQHLVPNFQSFGREGIFTGGGRSIVNATSERHGASWRMVVELGPTVRAHGIYPGGQSGNPGSRFYDNFIEKWAEGHYIDFGLHKRQEMENILFTTTLKPVD